MDAHSMLVFRQVARTGSMTAAAQALSWTQPAVSQHVRRLERALGTPLLLRSGRTTRLSEAGEVVARHAERIAAAMDAAQREVADLTGRRTGRVRLQAFPSASATLVPAALALLADRHPGLEPVTTEANPIHAERAVRAGDCDVAVVSTYDDDGRTDYPDLVVVPLLVEPVLAVLPAGSALGVGATLSLDRLSDQTWIAGCEMCRGHLVRAAAAAGFAPDIRHATDDPLVAQGLVAAELGVTLLPARALTAVRHPGIVAVPVEGQHFRVSAVARPETAEVPAVAALLEVLTEAAAAEGRRPQLPL
jgi:DNA-binding transcriptional LysR family regulator